MLSSKYHGPYIGHSPVIAASSAATFSLALYFSSSYVLLWPSIGFYTTLVGPSYHFHHLSLSPVVTFTSCHFHQLPHSPVATFPSCQFQQLSLSEVVTFTSCYFHQNLCMCHKLHTKVCKQIFYAPFFALIEIKHRNASSNSTIGKPKNWVLLGRSQMTLLKVFGSEWH